jgi:hypothetical protein
LAVRKGDHLYLDRRYKKKLGKRIPYICVSELSKDSPSLKRGKETGLTLESSSSEEDSLIKESSSSEET